MKGHYFSQHAVALRAELGEAISRDQMREQETDRGDPGERDDQTEARAEDASIAELSERCLLEDIKEVL